MLMVENFSLMRKDDPMPTQMEYRIQRASCVRELQKKTYRGQFHYYTGPKSYYPNKVIDASPPPISQALQLETAMEKLSLEDKQQFHKFATTFEKSVTQHTVWDKSKEDTRHLPYQISFRTQPREPGFTVTTASLLGEPNPEENNGTHNQQTPSVRSIVLRAGGACCKTCSTQRTILLFSARTVKRPTR